MALDTNTEQLPIGFELSLGREYSEEVAARIDQDVLQLLGERYRSVRSLLEGSRQKLDQLVEVLIMDETIDADGLLKILGQRSLPAEDGRYLSPGET